MSIEDTDRDGYEPQPMPRRRTSPIGIPVYVTEQPSRRIAEDDSGPAGATIEQRIEMLENRARGQRRLVRTAFIGAIGSVGAVLVWALSASNAAGAERAQMRALEDAVRELRAVVFRVPWPRMRHDDEPPLQPAAPLIQPAPKGTP